LTVKKLNGCRKPDFAGRVDQVSICSLPARTQTELEVPSPRLLSFHAGSPSAVIIEMTWRPLDKSISGNLPKSAADMTVAPSSCAKALGQRSPSLNVPHQMRRLPSIRQLHSIISVHSPRGLPGEPSRLRLGCTLTNSRKIADPYPCQIRLTGRPMSAAEKLPKSGESGP
jgi:hypothetical protein